MLETRVPHEVGFVAKFHTDGTEVKTTRIPISIGYRWSATQKADSVDGWIEMAKRDGTIDRPYAHWILGEESRDVSPRWCVLRDVLGWVD